MKPTAPPSPAPPPAAPPLASGEIRRRAARGVASTFSSQFAGQLLRLLLGVYLARRVTPDDFGLLAIALALGMVFDLLRDQGMTLGLIQAKELDDEDLQSAFRYMSVLTAVEVLVMVALAPAVAWFYHRPELAEVTLAMAAASAATGLAALPTALLKRNLQFVRFSAIQIGSLVLSAPFIAAAAAAGWGYRALMVYAVLPNLLALAGTWFACDWRPARRASPGGWRRLAARGRRFLAVDFLNQALQMADALILGRLLPAAQLGLYQRAHNTRFLAAAMVDSTLVPVSLSGLARLQDRPDAFWKAYRTSVFAISALLAPAALVLALAPGDLLGVVFGAAWIPAGPVLRFNALLLLLHPLLRTTHSGLLALGRPDALGRWLLVSLLLLVAGLFAGRPWGLPGVAAGMVLSQLLALPLGLASFAREGGTSVRELLRPALPILAPALLLGLACLPLARLAGPADMVVWLRLALAAAAAGLLLLFTAWHAFHSETGRMAISLAAPLLPFRRRA